MNDKVPIQVAKGTKTRRGRICLRVSAIFGSLPIFMPTCSISAYRIYKLISKSLTESGIDTAYPDTPPVANAAKVNSVLFQEDRFPAFSEAGPQDHTAVASSSGAGPRPRRRRPGRLFQLSSAVPPDTYSASKAMSCPSATPSSFVETRLCVYTSRPQARRAPVRRSMRYIF